MDFELIPGLALLGVAMLAALLLFTPYEAFLEGVIALAIFAAALAGFLMHPRREVFYVRTSVQSIDQRRHRVSERDFLAVRVVLTRLWLLFVPTFLAVSVLMFFAAGGPVKFSFLNWFFSSRLGFTGASLFVYPPLFVVLLVSVWIDERRVMRDAEACSARSFSVSHARFRHFGRVSYQFMGEHGEYYGGYSLYFGLVQPLELATIVFHNARNPELNKIAMGFLFHRLIVLGRGVTELDNETATAQMALAETTSGP
jgi:hypothetical protein